MSKILNGKELAEIIAKDIKNSLIESQKPTLLILTVGDDVASKVYVRNKLKACEDVGIFARQIICDPDTTTSQIVRQIKCFNMMDEVDGIIVQLPLPEHIDKDTVIQAISPEKDVDGFSFINQGKLQYNVKQHLEPCTAKGIMSLLGNNMIDVSGRHVVIVGRSNIVGKPLSSMMLSEDATVTIVHSKTENIERYLKQADIIVSAVGKPKFISPEMIGSGQVLIDVGISKDENGKVCGDFHSDCYVKSYAYTPVPGGVGPMTVAMLMMNTMMAMVSKQIKKIEQEEILNEQG